MIFPTAASITSPNLKRCSDGWPAFLDAGGCDRGAQSAKSVCSLKSIGIAPLPSSRVPRRLQDIVDNAQAIVGYTKGMDLTAFEEQPRRRRGETFKEP